MFQHSSVVVFSLVFALLLPCGSIMAGSSGAKVWEQTVVLPTYKVAPADPNPRFYSGRTYQGAKATFYPYPVSDQMTETRENRSYKAVYLENPYVQISVLPELGGRIFTALDKGNNYDFFYRQHVIKPALIGMLGAWISGGVEWNVPHHHRASSFMPVDYTIEKGADGSQTLWVGETELRHRMKWMVGLTLKPDRSYIEMTVKLFNRTPEAQSFLFWINPAVHANPNYQVIFPPSVEWAVQHAKPEFAGWPVAHQRYGGTDYSRGVDISWWKNHPSPVSFFAWDCQEDFFGGYDHGKEAGVVQVSNHHVSPGKKFFEWGNGPEGEMWTKILSDEDGPYLELMAGSYSDNQPDYSWCQPYETKVFKHYWYPVRELGGLKNANTEAAVNLEVSNRTARIAFNTTAAHQESRALLMGGERVLLDKTIRIAPNEPFVASVVLPEDVNDEDLKARLLAHGEQELIAYQPFKRAGSSMPKPVKKPISPKDIPSNEELYLTGLRIEQLYSPSFEAATYYQEALRRDPGDYRANTALASLYCREGRFIEAEPLARAAVVRATENYIRSKDCEAQYYLGVSLRAQGKNREARDAFYHAIWGNAWQAAGYHALAELACGDGNYHEALELVNRSIQAGALNSKAWELRASVLRKLKSPAEARQTIQTVLKLDPLNACALFERSLLGSAGVKRSNQQTLVKLLHGEVAPWLELAIDYANCGLFEDAAAVLELFSTQAMDKQQISPLVYYYLASFHQRLGKAQQAATELAIAAKLPAGFCFPFQLEAEPILREAMERNPNDARAPYYLGNLLFDAQPLKAIEVWEKSIQLDPNFAPAQRNLGLARAQSQKDVPGATACLEKALALNPDEPRFYYELDILYEAGGASVEKRLQMLSQKPETVARRDDTVTRRIALLTVAGRAEEALGVLRQRHFHNWEGSASLHDVYVDACLQRGREFLRKGESRQALEVFQSALEYPANQEVGKPRHEQRVAQIYFLLAKARQSLGQDDASRAAFERAANASESAGSEAQYYKALALRELGNTDEATKFFQNLEKRGLEDSGREAEVVDYFAKFGEKRAERLRLAQAHFVAGLGCDGLGRSDDARAHFRQALELHPAHLGARTAMVKSGDNEAEWSPKNVPAGRAEISSDKLARTLASDL